MKIALFFTYGMSLKGWSESGLLYRDSLLYVKLAEAGHDIVFVTYGGPDEIDYLPKTKSAADRFSVLFKPDGIKFDAYADQIVDLYGEVLADVDLIKCHQATGGAVAAKVARRLGKPFLARVGYLVSIYGRSMRQGFRKRFKYWREERTMFRQATVFCVPNAHEIPYVARRYGVDPSRGRVCPNWIDTDQFSPRASREKRPRRICFVGRFEEQKRPFDLIEAAKSLEDVELVMIGGGRFLEELKERAVASNLTATILDRVPNEELPGWLASSSMFCLPSQFEGSPKAVMEAMASGLPVVSTDIQGNKEAFQHNQQGLKVAVGDVNGLVEALQFLLDNPERAREMGQAGRGRIETTFSVQAALDRELAILDEISD